MLRLEHGMSAHRSLPSVVRRIRRRETRTDEILGMAPDSLDALVRNVLQIIGREMESCAELGLCESPKR